MITSAEEFIYLRTSKKMEEYCRAADEPASEEVWLEVIEKYPDMREEVAHNKTVKGKMLDILSKDSDHRVRAQVARRRVAGEEILSRLVHDPDESVRSAVLYNPKVSKEIIMLLADDKSKTIREAVKRRLDNFK